MSIYFKETIDHVGDQLKASIEKASDEIAKQRGLTKQDLEELIVFASDKFGEALDTRIDKVKTETSELITSKLSEFRNQLAEAADQQKKATFRNVLVGIGGAIVVSIFSLLNQRSSAQGLDALAIYRTIAAGITAGYLLTMVFRFVYGYLSSPDLTKNSVIIGASYIDALKPKVSGVHFVVFIISLFILISLNNVDGLVLFINSISG